MKYFIMAASLFLIAACNAGPSKDEFREVIRVDNHTHVSIMRDNYTSITVTDKDHNTSVTNNNSTTSSSDTTNNSNSSGATSTPIITMMNSNTYDTTATLWALNSMPTLTFFIEGESKLYGINQNGVKPGVDNFTISTTGFFTYTIDKSLMVLRDATVSSDNTSDVTLIYKTNLYTYVQNAYKTEITELAPVEFTIRVK